MDAFLVRLVDPQHQEYVQKYPFLHGPDAALNAELRAACQARMEIRTPPLVAFSHEAIDIPLEELVSERDWSAIVATCARLGLDKTTARGMVNAWGWKVARSPRSARRILSMGCSAGHELLVLRALFPEAELNGVDYDVTVPTEWRKALRLGELKRQPVEEYLSDHRETFDLVFSNHTLEHVSTPDRTLRLVHEALVPRGAIVSALPLEGDASNPYYQELLRVAERRDEIDPHLDFEFINPGHAWKTNREDLASTLERSGFCDIRMFTRVNYPSYLHNDTPLHASQFARTRVLGRLLESATLRPLRLGLRWMYPAEMPRAVTRTYYRIAGRCWFSRTRLLHELMHEVLVIATRGKEEGV